jgi:hypothetical protein
MAWGVSFEVTVLTVSGHFVETAHSDPHGLDEVPLHSLRLARQGGCRARCHWPRNQAGPPPAFAPPSSAHGMANGASGSDAPTRLNSCIPAGKHPRRRSMAGGHLLSVASRGPFQSHNPPLQFFASGQWPISSAFPNPPAARSSNRKRGPWPPPAVSFGYGTPVTRDALLHALGIAANTRDLVLWL